MDTKGKATSDPAQIAALAAKMATDIDAWATPAQGGHKRRLVLYAHGGLVGEDLGIQIADRMINWWRQNYIYPVHIVWESDAATTILGFLQHQLEDLPFGGQLAGGYEQLDTLLEITGRSIQRLWKEMKANARLASAPWSRPIDATAPGVTAFIKHLKAYRTTHPDLEVHLVGHSAGSVMLAGVVERLAAENIPVESLQLMAGAISIDEFLSDVASRLAGVPGSSGMVRRFTAYDLEETWELDDVCPGPPTPAVYHKSLLYFVARALEPDFWEFEKPMVGLARTISAKLKSNPSKSLLDLIGGPSHLVLAPNSALRPDSRSTAHGHGDFDDDAATMTSVLLRILNQNVLTGTVPYRKGGWPSG
jgi:pimeloyl-ACP methyl ester carboxylesterase